MTKGGMLTERVQCGFRKYVISSCSNDSSILFSVLKVQGVKLCFYLLTQGVGQIFLG